MDWQKDQHSTSAAQSSRLEPTQASTTKLGIDWEQPDFEEFDLCMEVTAYVYYWQ